MDRDSPKMNRLSLDDLSNSASSSRPTRPSLSRNPSSGSYRRASPSNPYQTYPFPPNAASSYPPRSKVGLLSVWRKVGSMIPPGMRRVLMSSPVLGVTLLIFLLILVFYVRTSPTSTLPTLSKSTLPDVALPSPKAELDTGPIKPDPGDITLPDLPDLYTPYFPTFRLPTALLHLPLLAVKLHTFLTRPITSHTPESEDEEHRLCPARLSDRLVNPDQLRGDRDFWRGVDTAEIARRRTDVVKWLDRRVERGEAVLGGEGVGQGRGIVLTGGNQDTTLRALSLLRHLRRLEVDLPIEVFHYPDELLDQGRRREIEGLGARIVEIHGVSKDAGAWKNFQIKGLAIVQSSFREILYLDSDNIPLRNPTHLFSAPIYLEQGRAVFWPDLSKDHPDNAIWRIMGDTCSLDHWTFESGQIVIDKAGNEGLNLAALIIAAEMQVEHKFWFHLCGGDKDTYRWAFRALGLQWGESPRWMSALGFLNGFEGGRFCGHTTLQYDLVIPEGLTREQPLFVHSNLLKHLGASGLGRGSTFTHVKRMSDDRISNPTLNYGHLSVYQGRARGMCLDLEWHDSTAEERGGVEIETIEVGDIEGDAFRGFEGAFFDEGGRIGGW